MKHFAISFILFLMATISLDVAPTLAQDCPSPPPNCTSSSAVTLAYLSGTYICLAVSAATDGTASNALLVVSSGGTGTFSAKLASNASEPSGTTFQDFESISGTYCVNTDMTGYLSAGKDSCPLAMTISGGKNQATLIDTTEGTAQAVVCSKQ